MKKLALTNLIVLISIKFVSACEFQPGEEPVSVIGNGIYAMFFGSYILFIPLLILFLLRKNRELWTLVLSTISLILFLPTVFYTFMATMCGDGTHPAAVIIGEFFLMCLLFVIQLSSWISERNITSKLR